MSEFPPDIHFPEDTDSILTEALRSLPIPVPSADFDDRILTALTVPLPWWRRVWEPVQPLLLGASCSLALTLLLLHFSLSGPPSAPRPPSAALSNLATAHTPMPSLDALLDRPNLCAGSLAEAWNSAASAANERTEPQPAAQRPEPRRRAEVSRRLTLIV
ncbi:MAG: hypothetical protein ACRYFS_01905 [Janthinobacterium lividum]